MERVSTDAFTESDDLPQGEAKTAAMRAMFDAVAPRYDLVNRVMTLRMDVRWRPGDQVRAPAHPHPHR